MVQAFRRPLTHHAGQDDAFPSPITARLTWTAGLIMAPPFVQSEKIRHV
jgi:hypothetical protein